MKNVKKFGWISLLFAIICVFFVGCAQGVENAVEEVDKGIKDNKVAIYVSSNNLEYGSVSGEGIYNVGDDVVIKAVPENNYKFDHWDDGNREIERTIKADERKFFTAYFIEKEIFEVNLTCNNDSLGMVTITGSRMEGESVEITATAYTDCRFLNWSDGDTESTRILYMDKDYTLTAIFASGNLYVINNYNVIVEHGTLANNGISVSISATNIYNFGYWTCSLYDENYIYSLTNTINVNVSEITDNVTFICHYMDSWFFGLRYDDNIDITEKLQSYDVYKNNSWVDVNTSPSSNNVRIINSYMKMYGNDAEYYVRLYYDHSFVVDSDNNITYNKYYVYAGKVLHTPDGSKYIYFLGCNFIGIILSMETKDVSYGGIDFAYVFSQRKK